MVVQRRANGEKPLKKELTTVARREQAFEYIINVLESHLVDSGQPLSIVAVELKEYLDGHFFGAPSKQMTESASQNASLTASPGLDSSTPADFRCGTILADDERFRRSSTSATCRTKRTSPSYMSHQRGRSTLPQGASRYSTTPYPSVAHAQDEGASETDEEEPMLAKPKEVCRSFRIDDSKEVIAFLTSRLKGMQQLADKKIAKAWIRGICPKKQANFPYQNNRRQAQSGQKPTVPGWWPHPETVCRFTEPDHIKRDERMKLCLHLLRLRPSPELLKAWNQNKSEPHTTHVARGWTAFLEELAGNEIFDDLPKENKQRTLQRQQLMREMYQVAKMEEEFLAEARDGSDRYEWHEDEEDRKILPTKRSRQSSIASCVEWGSRASSTSLSCTRAKRTRTDSFSDASTIVQQSFVAESCDTAMIDGHAAVEDHGLQRKESFQAGGFRPPLNEDKSHNDTTASHARNSISCVGQCDGQPVKMENGFQHRSGRPQQSWPNHSQCMDNQHPFTTSPASHFVEQEAYHNPMATASFPGNPEYDFPHLLQNPNVMQVHQVGQVPETLPMTPVFSPSGMASMPMGNFAPQCYDIPSEHPCTNAMSPSQYFMPSHQGPVANVHMPMHGLSNVYHEPPPGTAQRYNIPITQYHGLPYTDLEGWPHR